MFWLFLDDILTDSRKYQQYSWFYEFGHLIMSIYVMCLNIEKQKKI